MLAGQGFPEPVIERSEDVRELLVDSIGWLLQGRLDCKVLNSIAQTCRVILEGWRINLEERQTDREERERREARVAAIAALPDGDREQVVDAVLAREILRELTPAQRWTLQAVLGPLPQEPDTSPPPIPGESRTCEHCRRTFAPVAEVQTYCSPGCKAKHQAGEKAAPAPGKPRKPKQNPPQLQQCARCGLGFYRVEGGNLSPYCSEKCRQAAGEAA